MDYEFPACAGFVCDKSSVTAAGLRAKVYGVLCCSRYWCGCILLGCSVIVYIRMALFCSEVLLYLTLEWLYSARMFCYTLYSNDSILLGCSVIFYIRMALFCSDVLLYSTFEWLYSARMFWYTRQWNGSILPGCSVVLYIRMAPYCRRPLVFTKRA
jgi:hypothetical protein